MTLLRRTYRRVADFWNIAPIPLAAIVFVAIMLPLDLLGGSSAPVAGAQTGGAIIPCPGSPYGNGWFDNGGIGSINCTQQDNHIVVDSYNRYGVRTQAALDVWYGAHCDNVTFENGAGSTLFRIRFGNNDVRDWAYGYGCGIHGVPVTVKSSPSRWEQTWSTGGSGVVNQCFMTYNRNCSSISGSWTVRNNGINGGPQTSFYFGGYCLWAYCPSAFYTGINIIPA